ncbi:MAG: hypothetical protein M1549_01775 [Candidatus Dependentiae bacterium]|nr:hypothetical protein [Candidatus Dependentiae bacterium]
MRHIRVFVGLCLLGLPLAVSAQKEDKFAKHKEKAETLAQNFVEGLEKESGEEKQKFLEKTHRKHKKLMRKLKGKVEDEKTREAIKRTKKAAESACATKEDIRELLERSEKRHEEKLRQHGAKLRKELAQMNGRFLERVYGKLSGSNEDKKAVTHVAKKTLEMNKKRLQEAKAKAAKKAAKEEAA